MDGLLLVDKPSGWTSFDVVAKVRGIAKQETGIKRFKVGHCGTLDPLATGLLVICLGSYCKRAQEFTKLDKVYKVTMKLGQTSTTCDEEGDKTTISEMVPSDDAVQQVMAKFTGDIMQTPPAFSAVKVNGQRAYKLAREGKEVVIEPRRVTIHHITDVHYDYPQVTFTAKVGSGTYIRSLVEDIGKELGTGAYMSALHRTQIDDFAVDAAISPDGIQAKDIIENLVVL